VGRRSGLVHCARKRKKLMKNPRGSTKENRSKEASGPEPHVGEKPTRFGRRTGKKKAGQAAGRRGEVREVGGTCGSSENATSRNAGRTNKGEKNAKRKGRKRTPKRHRARTIINWTLKRHVTVHPKDQK